MAVFFTGSGYIDQFKTTYLSESLASDFFSIFHYGTRPGGGGTVLRENVRAAEMIRPRGSPGSLLLISVLFKTLHSPFPFPLWGEEI